MDAIELALRKCLNVLVSSATITERKRNAETFIDLLKDNRTHELLDNQVNDENSSKTSISWNEIFDIIREYTVNELASIRSKSGKTATPDTKYQEALKLFRSVVENANTRGPQLDGRSLLESILSIITSQAWSTCTIVIRELNHLLIHNVLCFHKYLNDLREQEWIDLCELYMSLAKNSEKSVRESDQSLYSSYLKYLLEKLAVYTDLDSSKSLLRKDLFNFLQHEIEQLTTSNHFSVIENFLCSLNIWSWKYLFDMPDEIFRLGYELLPSILDIWRRKCSDKPKSEIIKFCRLQLSIHHPEQRKNTLEVYDDIWTKNLRDLNDLILREIDEICLKRLNNRQNQNEFLVRYDLLHLASSVFYQLSSNELHIKSETMDVDETDELLEPSAKRTRYEHSSITTNTQMKSFRNLFQSTDSYHQAVGFQILSIQLERDMKLSSIDGDYYMNTLKRYLTDERRPSLLANALRCLYLLLTRTSHCQLTSDLAVLIQPLIHIPICESSVIEILSEKQLFLSHLCACSSVTSLKYIFNRLTRYSNYSCSFDDENRLLNKFLPDLMSLYRNNEHDLSMFFQSYSPEYTHLCATILMQFSSFDVLPFQANRNQKSELNDNEFDQIERQWLQLKLLVPSDQLFADEEERVEFCLKMNTCELNLNMFKRFNEIYGKNVRFILQLKDKHLGERSKLILHFVFLGIHMVYILQLYFSESNQTEDCILRFIENIQNLFTELTDETVYLFDKTREIVFINDLFEHMKNVIYSFSSSSLLKPISPSLNQFCSILYGFLESKYLSCLYNYTTEEYSTRKPSDIEGIQCPTDDETNEKLSLFEILLLLCFQATYDQMHSSKSFLLNYQPNQNLLIRILDEKLYLYLEELPLPDPVSLKYLQRFFSFISRNTSQYSLILRHDDFENISNLFTEAFRVYRRDIRVCQRLFHYFRLFIKKFYSQIRREFFTDKNWLHMKKIIDAFWQMTMNRSQLLNSQLRRSIIEIKQILAQDENVLLNEMQIILNDSSYFVRVEANKLCRHLFYEEDQPKRLKSSKEQEKVYHELIGINSSLFFYLINQNEYLSCQISFHLIRLGIEKKLAKNLIQHILPKTISIQRILQYYHRELPYEIKDFPWECLDVDPSNEEYRSFIFSTYFISTVKNRRELNAIFPDMKSSLIEYFPHLQGCLLPLLATKKANAEENRQLIEKFLTKNEYNRLLKQKMTMIIFQLLLTYENDEQSEFYDPWAPQPILPVYTWPVLKTTFNYVKQLMNMKTFVELLLKFTDISEILLNLSSKLFATNSIHERLRLLDVFSLFLTDMLLNSLDNEYLHSVLRDSTYILLRYIEKYSQRKSIEVYQQELNEKIFDILCGLLYQLCVKGLAFDSSIYLNHVPDIISTLINAKEYLTKERIQTILIHIYQTIRNDNDPVFNLLSYAIEKLNYTKADVKRKSSQVTTSDYLYYLSLRRSSLPAEWILDMFHQHLDIERQNPSKSSLSIDPSVISSVKQQLLECLTLKSNHILAGKCLSKCLLFLLNNNEENLDDDSYEPIPLWIFEDLIMFYLIDNEQEIVECTRYTLKAILSHPIGQELYQKHLQDSLIQLYAKPFLSPINCFRKLQSNFISSDNPWLISPTISFETWFLSLINSLFKQIEYYYLEKNETGHPYVFLFHQLKHLVQLKIDFAKKIFPHLVYCLLVFPTKLNLRQMLTKNFNFLIEQLLGSSNEKNSALIQIAKCIFRTIHYLSQCPIDGPTKRGGMKSVGLNFENHFWLDVDYFQLAKCASKYQCHQSAIVFTDIWTTKQRSILPENDYSMHLYHSDMDLLSSSTELVDLFVRIHSNINQPDEFYGLDKCFQNRPNLYGEFNQMNNNYYDSLFYYDQAIESSKVIQSLRLCGFNHILEQYLKQVSSISDQIFYRIQLTSILKEQNPLTQWQIMNDQSENHVREDILSIIQRQMRVSSSSIPQLIDHNLWSNVTEFRECFLVNIVDDLITNYENPDILSNIWKNQANTQIKEDLFDHNDELLLTRVALTHKLVLHNLQVNPETKQTLFVNLVTQLCQNALESKKLQLCDRYLSDFSPLINPSYSHELSFLRAKVLVLRHQDTAGEYLRQLIQSPLSDSIHIRCRLLLCEWLNETRCETSSTIKQQLDAISTSMKNLDLSSLSLIFESYLAMAHFSDNEYQRLTQLLNSPMFENKRSLIKRNQVEYSKQEKLDPLGRYTKVLKRSLDMDRKEIEEQKRLQYSYLISTLNNYLTCLKLYSDLSKKLQRNPLLSVDMIKNNSVPEIMITSKCLSYWLTNSSNEDVNKTLKKNLANIPTHFFLPFVYQMAARMVIVNDKLPVNFHTILLEYLSKCIIDHPHHVLPVIFALANAHKDAHITQQQTPKKTTTNELIQLNYESSNDARSRAAQYLLEECAKVKPQLVDQMRKLNDAYIEAAYWDVTPAKNDQQSKDSNGKNPTFSKHLRLMHIKDFSEVAVPTISIPVANDGIYKNIETVKHFNTEYAMVGGVNAPKKLLCHSSTGRQLPQLLKGKDDLRQDAVMQQLFTVVNRLLDKDELTRHRSMNIRTYKVVPLTQKSGVLEWCEGTITFGDYLAKPDGAHSRYHPDDWTAMDCRRHIHKATNAGKDERQRAFIQACSKLRPVFRYFFYEYYNKSNIWHKKKQAYAKSVATSSIVGYIVGLGDRHVQNILIDTQTAEVIHIDLGVAFDQGKMLPIPETIPFRLTRDVIDGLGICGTEGLFKKSCEITLELMRQYADTLITIIEVFLYDPLYQWQLSPQKALQLQQQFDKTNADSVVSSSGRSSGKGSMLPPPVPQSSTPISGNESGAIDTNKMAERLLLGVRQKLQGIERLNQMTIKAHVNMLIQEATSIENLSQLFAGWQPYFVFPLRRTFISKYRSSNYSYYICTQIYNESEHYLNDWLDHQFNVIGFKNVCLINVGSRLSAALRTRFRFAYVEKANRMQEFHYCLSSCFVDKPMRSQDLLMIHDIDEYLNVRKADVIAQHYNDFDRFHFQEIRYGYVLATEKEMINQSIRTTNLWRKPHRSLGEYEEKDIKDLFKCQNYDGWPSCNEGNGKEMIRVGAIKSLGVHFHESNDNLGRRLAVDMMKIRLNHYVMRTGEDAILSAQKWNKIGSRLGQIKTNKWFRIVFDDSITESKRLT
ncbi:unnamed protein product [Adineta ricciae]|uniref:non-specific serine/threonine protein kinase n=1 Tax=Adineta ricciae TaxID=249248 RepID=A0A814CDK0_ADIRI|nr:unnamed protein product [Adineta ricciae]